MSISLTSQSQIVSTAQKQKAPKVLSLDSSIPTPHRSHSSIDRCRPVCLSLGITCSSVQFNLYLVYVSFSETERDSYEGTVSVNALESDTCASAVASSALTCFTSADWTFSVAVIPYRPPFPRPVRQSSLNYNLLLSHHSILSTNVDS